MSFAAIAVGGMVVAAGTGIAAQQQAKKGAKAQAANAIFSNNLSIRELLRQAREAQGTFITGFEASGADYGSSAFQAGQTQASGVASSGVAANTSQVNIQMSSIRARERAANFQIYSNIASAISSVAMVGFKTFGTPAPQLDTSAAGAGGATRPGNPFAIVDKIKATNARPVLPYSPIKFNT